MQLIPEPLRRAIEEAARTSPDMNIPNNEDDLCEGSLLTPDAFEDDPSNSLPAGPGK